MIDVGELIKGMDHMDKAENEIVQALSNFERNPDLREYVQKLHTDILLTINCIRLMGTTLHTSDLIEKMLKRGLND